MILGESGDSGHNSDLDGRAKIPVSSTVCEGFLGGGKTSPLIRDQGRQWAISRSEPVPQLLRHLGLCTSYRNFFSKSSFCLGRILGLFFRDGCVISLSGPLRSLRIPLAISVETSALEIAGLDLGLGLKMGDLSMTDLWRGGVCQLFLYADFDFVLVLSF